LNPNIRFSDRLRYWMDNLFSRGTGALIASLGVLSVVLIVISALIITLTGFTQVGDEPYQFGEAVWLTLMRTLDAGTMGGDTGWGFRFIMLILPTMGGIFIISTFIGVLSSGIEGKLEELRKGRSRVIESDHTIILGWSEQIFTIITELVAANENLPHSTIVILGDKDKLEMDGEIATKVESTGRTRVVTRSGSPMEMADLALISLNTAKSIIAISPDTPDPDSEVIKTVLAITHHPNRRKEAYNIVAEIRDLKNMDAAQVVGHGEVEWVMVGDLVARVIAQTCRQSGLSVVYTELLDFGGDEIYFAPIPALTGKTFGETLRWFDTNAVLGIQTAAGSVSLNPPMNTVLQEGDRLILIAADDDQIKVSPSLGEVTETAIITAPALEAHPERNLILGWNWRGCAIINELDQYVAPGSSTTIVSDNTDIPNMLSEYCQALDHQKVVYHRGDPTNRRVLESIRVEEFNHVILLSNSDGGGQQQADARTLITLLHLRDMADRGGHNFSIVTEMLDIRNRNLADVARADDFIVSDKLVSLMLAQISENKYLNAVFADFFDPEGSEIYLKPVGEYVTPCQPVNFHTVVEAARRRNQVAFGYRITADGREASRQYGVHVNPLKSELVTFQPEDRIIVLSED